MFVCVCPTLLLLWLLLSIFPSLPFAASATSAAACVACAPLGVDIERGAASLVVTPIVQSEADALSSTVQCPRLREVEWSRRGAWHSGQQSLIFNVQSHFTNLTRDAYSFQKGSGEVGRRDRERQGEGVERHWDFPLLTVFRHHRPL